MAEKCPCQTDVQSCCACVSMHCDECHKPNRSKFAQGRFCSNCGRPLKAGLTRLYVPKEDIETARAEVAREIFEEIDRVREETTAGNIMRLTFFERLAELKKKYQIESTEL